ncbi:DUF1515 domain-containing protein [Devosia sp. D6-9]|nr:DUF1515 domain-containing protein [Devosia sp. D6-9]
MTQSEAQRMLLEMLRGLKEDIAEEREASRLSRAAMRDRIEEVVDRVGNLETTLAISGQIDAQVRAELDALRKSVSDSNSSIQPTVDEWRRIKAIGIGLVGLLALGGVSVGAALSWAGESVVSAVRAWLHIS